MLSIKLAFTSGVILSMLGYMISVLIHISRAVMLVSFQDSVHYAELSILLISTVIQ